MCAVDFDSKAVKTLMSKVEKCGLNGAVEGHVCSASDVSFIADAVAEFVLASGLLCCMVDHAGTIKEIKRILKPEGKAYLSITKGLRRRDPRTVTKQEWEEILREFTILQRGKV